jgi:hypothetical protein
MDQASAQRILRLVWHELAHEDARAQSFAHTALQLLAFMAARTGSAASADAVAVAAGCLDRRLVGDLYRRLRVDVAGVLDDLEERDMHASDPGHWLRAHEEASDTDPVPTRTRA